MAAHEDGDAPLATAKIDEILKYGQKLGVRRLTDLAMSATLLGHRELSAGQVDRARFSLEAGERLDPDLPEARWFRVKIAVATKSWGDLPRAFFGALGATFSDVESRRIFLARAVLLLTFSAAALGVAFVLGLVLAHGRRYAHDLLEVVIRFAPGPAERVLAFALLIAPLLLGFDLLWLLLVLFVAVFGYATTRQQAAAAVGLLATLPLLPTLDRTGYVLAVAASPILRGAEALKESRYDQRLLDDLESVKTLLPEDADVRFLLGRLYQALGQNDRAVAEYTTGAQNPAETRCLVNRGNIRFVDGDFGSAQEDFESALKRDPTSVPARYNLSLVYAETFRTIEAAEALRQARALDARMVQRFQESPTLVKVVSLGYSTADARKKIAALEGDPRSHRILGHFRDYKLISGFLQPLSLAIVLALAAAFGLAAYREARGGYASECQKCGRTFCRRCKPHRENPLLCSQCVHVYLKKDGVAIETKLQKLEEVKNRKKLSERIRLAANFFLPGLAAFVDSRPLVAAATTGVFLFAIAAAFFRSTLVASPRPVLGPAAGVSMLWGAVAVITWIVGQVWAFRRRPS
ncbi:MAG TPA: hypothetical protein VGR00_07910 [Thermoanaerobaculia bacterium]|nr:hypothetical protein [Thermoanaerobaculia bacterium]